MAQFIERGHRYDLNIWVQASQEGTDKFQAKLIDMSTTGLKLACMNELNPNKLITIAIPNGPTLTARTIWTSVGNYGCELIKPRGEDVLPQILDL